MANVCTARLTVVPSNAAAPISQELAGTIVSSLRAYAYDDFHVVAQEPEFIEIECGFRWSPPFEELLSATTIFPTRLRCLYEETGMCFMGAWRAADGKVLQDDCIDYE